ncbi:MAG: hypothetical protein RJB01_793 [Actinomycetota bacterium]
MTILAFILTTMVSPNLAMAADSETSGKVSQSQGERETAVLGKRLSEKFLGLLKAGDTAGLERFLAPEFQLQRATGAGLTKADYLRSLPTVGEFVVSDVVATRSDDVLVVRYLATVEGLAEGRMYTPGPAPRISTFVRSNGRWQIVSHANFNALLTPRHPLNAFF